jgi:hypothetical protein
MIDGCPEEEGFVEERCVKAMERIRTLEQWKDGNGGKGVEERLRHLEDMMEKISHKQVVLIVLMIVVVLQRAPDTIVAMIKVLFGGG